jgi:hypothetical protein
MNLGAANKTSEPGRKIGDFNKMLIQRANSFFLLLLFFFYVGERQAIRKEVKCLVKLPLLLQPCIL